MVELFRVNPCLKACRKWPDAVILGLLGREQAF
jgi:hypothetical protein